MIGREYYFDMHLVMFAISDVACLYKNNVIPMSRLHTRF